MYVLQDDPQQMQQELLSSSSGEKKTYAEHISAGMSLRLRKLGAETTLLSQQLHMGRGL